MQKQQLGLLIMIMLLLITACNGTSMAGNSSPVPTILPTPTTLKLLEQVDIAQRKWQSLKITNYHIVIKFEEAFASGVESQRDVTVKNGQVVNSFCVANICPAFVFWQVPVSTVDDLFSVTRGSTLRALDLMDYYDECVRGIGFDETYGYPKSMQVDCPDGADEEHSFQVISFEVVK